MIPAFLTRMLPAELVPALATLTDVLANGERIGPPDPAPLWAGLFASVGAEHGVEPELLAALACVRSGFDPAYIALGTPQRAGLLAVAVADADEAAAVTATMDELVQRDAGAVARVRANAHAAALELAERRATDGVGLAGALMHACDGDGMQAAHVLGVFFVYTARRLAGVELDTAALFGG